MDREPDELRGDAQRMLAMWRDAQDMPADARARVRRRLEAPAHAEAPKTTTRMWTIAFALAAAIVLAWWVSTLGDRTVQAQRDPAGEQASDRVQGGAPQTAAEHAPAELPSPVAPAPTIEAAPIEAPTKTRPRSAPMPEITASSLAREKTLIQQAWETLAARDPAGALRIVDTHAREFPEGVLAPERRAVAIVARCKRGDSDAKERAQTWLTGNARSPLADRVRAACEIDEAP